MSDKTLLSLPTEVLYRIFNHCDSQTVFCSIRHVCQRLYAVTETYDRLKLNVKYETERFSQWIYGQIQPSTIRSLTILDDESCISCSRTDISFIHLQAFTRLRSLTFHGISGRELECLLPLIKMNILDSLSITIVELEYKTSANLLTLAVLHPNPRRLILEYRNPLTGFSFTPIDCNLQELRVNRCDHLGCFAIIQQLPTLQTFVIEELMMLRDDKTRLSQSNLSSSSLLTSLTVDECSLSSETFTSLFSLTPALIYLKLASAREVFDCIFDGLYWEELISSKLRSLKTFDVFFTFRVWRDSHHFIDIDPPVASVRTKFWLQEKNWIMNYAYLIDSPAIWLYTDKFKMKRRETSGRCEISPTDNAWHLIRRSWDEEKITPTNEVSTALDGSRNNSHFGHSLY